MEFSWQVLIKKISGLKVLSPIRMGFVFRTYGCKVIVTVDVGDIYGQFARGKRFLWKLLRWVCLHHLRAEGPSQQARVSYITWRCTSVFDNTTSWHRQSEKKTQLDESWNFMLSFSFGRTMLSHAVWCKWYIVIPFGRRFFKKFSSVKVPSKWIDYLKR